jgi:teichuronic acid biosynthesis glycosyltransferase TuaC
MFPSRALPNHAVFVKHRIHKMARLAGIKIIVPVPYFPFVTHLKRYSFRKKIPQKDIIDGLEVYYPRFLSIPGILKPLDGLFLFLSSLIFIKIHLKKFDFDIIDSHLAYPDGYSAVLLGKTMKKPVSITLRGHDINNTPKYPVRRLQLKYALKNAEQIFSVASALKSEALKLGAAREKIFVTGNGVDTEVFKPLDMYNSRQKLDLPKDKKIIVSVGNLVERKGFHILLQALRRLIDRGRTNLYLVIVGGPGEEGDYSEQLHNLIENLKISGFVSLVGPQKNSDLPLFYNAADLSCLASSKEGWANVLLESLACGRPVVATNVWGTPEVISSKEYGILTDRNPESLANALEEALTRSWNHKRISSYAGKFTWDDIAYTVVRKMLNITTKH